ncbi:hypothetical protein SAMN05660297_00409 [Natronincola peptidivorans]|uniref:HMA domain-containing protein n=1 Tax=Natronincola peptidivorans TaxID=426128 RepID=A0A1H9YU59_9FIRM|nr:hypothetical protein [Natronincola peptidivorans]SES72667.1 hypothetical protein SAMN05660297_00409 [Natronincola peptidivorans]
MSIHNKIRQLEKQSSVTIRLLVKDMLTTEDYNIIVDTLKRYKGIHSIAPFTNKAILTINYSPSILSSHAIDYIISGLGYNQNPQKKEVYQYQSRKKGG